MQFLQTLYCKGFEEKLQPKKYNLKAKPEPTIGFGAGAVVRSIATQNKAP